MNVQMDVMFIDVAFFFTTPIFVKLFFWSTALGDFSNTF
jgi:hypothetical protein